MAELTPFQTVGPYFTIAMPAPGLHRLAAPTTEGERIRIGGRITDGAGAPVPDAVIETWQADAAGRLGGDRDGFVGFGRIPVEADGTYLLETIRPGAVAGPGATVQAPHILVGVLARGILTRLITRIYFPDEPANAADPILARVPPPRRHTLIARRTEEGVYRFDLVLQGPGETVFFDV
jgi:protocatechuate 3,4-dioxygenase, alpha subunit